MKNAYPEWLRVNGVASAVIDLVMDKSKPRLKRLPKRILASGALLLATVMNDCTADFRPQIARMIGFAAVPKELLQMFPPINRETISGKNNFPAENAMFIWALLP